MTQHVWLLSPLFTGIFVTLGIILFFQLLVRSLTAHSQKQDKPINYLVGRIWVLSVVYFSALGVYFEYVAARENQDVAFVNFRLLLLSYVIIFLGRRTSIIVIACSLIARLVFWGATLGTLHFLIDAVVMYVLFNFNLFLIRKHQQSQLVLVGVLNFLVGVFWFIFHFVRIHYFGDVPAQQALFYWVSFVIMNHFLYYGLTRLNDENDYLTTLTHQATVDPLTQLKNYAVFEKDFDRVFHESQESGQPLAMVTLDIDYFKRVNDEHGHLAGNQILVEISQMLAGAIRTIPHAHCYRVGGEEFNILLPNKSLEAASDFSYRLQRKVRERTFALKNGTKIKITLSMGVTALKDTDTTPNLLYERADQMLYHSKGEGRDRVTVSESPTSTTTAPPSFKVPDSE